MSLMLRKACQPILDSVNLQNYHIEINPHSKTMYITTECGKELFNIFGVTFSRLTPTNAEIEYATELLNAWLVKYNKDIQDYLAELDILNKMPKLPEGFTIRNQHIIYYDNRFTIRLDKSGNIVSIEALSIPFPNKGIFKLKKELYDKTLDLLHKEIARQTQEEVVRNLAKKLSSCSI